MYDIIHDTNNITHSAETHGNNFTNHTTYEASVYNKNMDMITDVTTDMILNPGITMTIVMMHIGTNIMKSLTMNLLLTGELLFSSVHSSFPLYIYFILF